MSAIGAIHLYLLPERPRARHERVPIRQRRKIGIAYAMYRPITVTAVSAKNAIGVFDALPISAGSATTAQQIAMKIVAFRGACDFVTFDQSCQPGIA